MITEQQIRDMSISRRSNWIVHTALMGNKAWKYRSRHGDKYYTNIVFSPAEPTWPNNTSYTEINVGDIVERSVIVQDVPDYTRLMDAAWEAELKIAELKLQVEYCQALKEVVIGKGEYVGLFDYIHATPIERCKAALIAILRGGSGE